MAEQTDGEGRRADLEHDQAVLLARRRARGQLNALAAHCPGHVITVETYPGREDRYVARAVTGSARPYLLITTDLSELCSELCGPGEHPWLIPLRLRRAGGAFRPGPAGPD